MLKLLIKKRDDMKNLKKDVIIGLSTIVILTVLVGLSTKLSKENTKDTCVTEKIESDTKNCIEESLKNSNFAEPEAILYIQDRCESKAKKLNGKNN